MDLGTFSIPLIPEVSEQVSVEVSGKVSERVSEFQGSQHVVFWIMMFETKWKCHSMWNLILFLGSLVSQVTIWSAFGGFPFS